MLKSRTSNSSYINPNKYQTSSAGSSDGDMPSRALLKSIQALGKSSRGKQIKIVQADADTDSKPIGNVF